MLSELVKDVMVGFDDELPDSGFYEIVSTSES
jgi:hypothetical protein